jgi:hypothetical protein
MNPEHPPLGKLLCDLPLLIMGVRLPFEHDSWQRTDEVAFGEQFLYANKLSPDRIREKTPIAKIGYSIYVYDFRRRATE